MEDSWRTASKDFNRYVQRLRRLHTGNSVQYLRTIEAHSDSYPHWHTILQFQSPISVSNVRYFDNVLYRKWKQLWTLGLSDYQPPLSGRNPVIYVIKYITKNSHTHKTIWKKLLVNVTATKDGLGSLPVLDVQETITPAWLEYLKKYRIKQCTWSRDFVFPAYPKPVRLEDCKQTLLT